MRGPRATDGGAWGICGGDDTVASKGQHLLSPWGEAESARSAEPGEGSGAVLYDLVPHPLASRVGLSPEGRGGNASSSRGLAGPRVSKSSFGLLAWRRERGACRTPRKNLERRPSGAPRGELHPPTRPLFLRSLARAASGPGLAAPKGAVSAVFALPKTRISPHSGSGRLSAA